MRVFKRLDTGVLVDALIPENAVAAIVGDIVAIYSPRDETLPLVCPDIFCWRHCEPPAQADYIVAAPEGWYWATDAWDMTGDKAFRLRPLSDPIPSVTGDALYQMPACCQADPPRPPMADGTVPPPRVRRAAPARPPVVSPLPIFIPPAFRR